jgi:hypothetical protein
MLSVFHMVKILIAALRWQNCGDASIITTCILYILMTSLMHTLALSMQTQVASLKEIISIEQTLLLNLWKT